MNRIIIFLLFSNKIVAQHPVYTHLTEKDGLPDIEFYDIVEDSNGIIWLAADKGLFSYDGKVFKNYSHPEKRGLSVFGLKLDSKDRVWCNNMSGQVFYINKDQLVLFGDFQDKVNGQLAIFTFIENNVVLSTETGVYEIDSKGLFKNKIFGGDTRIIQSLIKKDTLLSFGDDKILVATKGKKLTVKYDLKEYRKYSFNIWDIASVNNTDLVYAYKTTSINVVPKLFYGENNKLHEISLPKELVVGNAIMKFYDINNELWICTNKGVFIYQFIKGKLHYKKTYFKDIPVSRLLKDRNNNYWFTTLTNGIFIIPNLYIEKYNITKGKENIMAVSNLGEKSLMMGSIKGDLMIVDKGINQISYLDKKVNSKLYTISEGKRNMYLSFGKASLIYDKNSKQFTNDRFLYNAKDVTFLDENNLLYVTHRTASVINVKTKKNTEFRATRATAVHYSKNKEKYIGYIDGAEKYNKKNESIKLKFKDQRVFANDITETSNNIVWLSTLKKGVIGFKNGKFVKQYSEENGLLSNQVGEIEGEGPFLWVSTHTGLQLINTNNNQIKSLTRKDGVNSFNITGFIPDEKSLYFSSNKGLFKIDKKKAFKENKILDFYFTSIEVDDKEVTEKELYTFDSSVRKIKFNFHINGFLSHDNIAFNYKLTENSKKWNVVDKGVNQITFNNLAVGTYTFKLKATSLSDEKETKERIIKIIITPPIYKQTWFIVMIVFFSILLGWFIFYKILKGIKKSQKKALQSERMQKDLVASKLTTLQTQMNPHFTFNALNSIQNLVLKGDKKNAYNYLTKFSSLLRESLTLSTKSFVFFEEEISILRKYLELEKLRFKDNFYYEIKGEELIGTIKIPTMIIQPFVENAIKHGLLHKFDDVGKITIEFFQDELFTCIITDNGVGKEIDFNKDKKSNIINEFHSTGAIYKKLKILKDYYKLDIGFSYQKVDIGTKVIIKIPYNFIDE